MKIYSYIVNHDTGFAPNPFYGYCTLANCKPKIRKTAEIGDLIFGLSCKARNNYLIYAMKVNEKLTFREYFNDNRFMQKKPKFNEKKVICKCGDNIYEPISENVYRQLQSMHSLNRSCEEDLKNKKKDLSGEYVLISNEYVYFGRKGPVLPDGLKNLIVGRGHKNNFPEDTKRSAIDFFDSLSKGIQNSPTIWPEDDDSWKGI
jgi:hypothetical protein